MKWLLLALMPVMLAGSLCTKSTSAGTAQPASDEVTLVISTGVVGHLEPCGCSPDQRGGVSRAAAAVDAIRKEGHPVILVDGGDRFFPGAHPPEDPLVANQQKLEASAMADITRLMRYDALVLGDRDAGSATSLQSGELPPVLDTGDNAVPGTRAFLVLDAGGHKIGLVAVGASAESFRTLKARAASAREAGAELIVLFAYRDFAGARELLSAADEAGVRFVVATRAVVPETHESAALADAVPALFTVAARGEALLRIDLSLGGPRGESPAKVPGGAERDQSLEAMQQRIDLLRSEVKSSNPQDPLAKAKMQKMLELEERRSRLAASPPPKPPPGRNTFTHAFIPMSPKLPEQAEARAVVDRFHTDAARQNLAYIEAHPRECPRAQPGQPSFTGHSECINCHEEAYEFWKTTPHAHAYQSLVDKGRQHDVACIGCHVVGYEKPGGACSIADVKGRTDVQCESCHGPGSIHAEEGTRATMKPEVPEAACRKCHDPENSPHFNDKTYRPQILGPGHGAPIAKKTGK